MKRASGTMRAQSPVQNEIKGEKPYGTLFLSSERLNHIFSKLTKHGRLTELEIKGAMREVRVALLEADVNILSPKNSLPDVL